MESTTPPTTNTGPLSRSWYGSSIADFLQTDPDTIIAQLVRNGEFDLLSTQRDAWLVQMEFLQSQLINLTGSLFLEFNIPRMGRRIDAVLLIGPALFVLEFKVGESVFERSAVDQVWDYALDLKNFHEASHSAAIVPILIATKTTASPPLLLQVDEDKVYRPLRVHTRNFREALNLALRTVKGEPLDEQQWSLAPYLPTPTIVEAARALYAQHSVEAIARYDAGAQNLRVTSARIEELVDEARQQKCKLICFVTGVPGAGKTLVGLNVATRRRDKEQPTHAVFLSGNGPLVAVLREALTRDEVARQRGLGNRVRKGKVAESVKAFIQNVHNFRDEALRDFGPPAEHVVIFDEAQRAWNLRQTASFMKRRKNQPGFSDSEPEYLISCMDRHAEWAVIVCLVGGGQEIHTGEAGIDAWLEAVNSRFPNWRMYISSRLTDSEYTAGNALESVCKRQNTHFDDCLHLAVSMRSFRAENVSAFVKAMLDCEKQQACETFAKLIDRYHPGLKSGKAMDSFPCQGHRTIRASRVFESTTS
jgi:Schlafen group 3, DNA/RNA helicase domain